MPWKGLVLQPYNNKLTVTDLLSFRLYHRITCTERFMTEVKDSDTSHIEKNLDTSHRDPYSCSPYKYNDPV